MSAAARSDVAQWAIVIAGAVMATVAHVAAREAVEVPLMAETMFIEVEAVVAVATAMSTKLVCYSVA